MPIDGCKVLAGLAVDVAAGDLRDQDSLQRALTGCTRLFHVAADYRLWVPDPATMYAINVEGTRHLLAAAASQGLERVVYTSTVGALGNPGDGNPGAEDTPVTLKDMVGHYKRSKFLAEQAARDACWMTHPHLLASPGAMRRLVGAFTKVSENIDEVREWARRRRGRA